MNKPISVLMTELNDNMISIINNSGLPPVVLEPIVRDIYNSVSNAAKSQVQEEREQYLASLQEESAEKEENND